MPSITFRTTRMSQITLLRTLKTQFRTDWVNSKSCAEFAERIRQRTYVLDAAMLMEVLYGFTTPRLAGIASNST